MVLVPVTSSMTDDTYRVVVLVPVPSLACPGVAVTQRAGRLNRSRLFCYERVINRHSQWTVKTDATALDLLRLLCDFTSLFQPPHRNRSPLTAPIGSMNENNFEK